MTTTPKLLCDFVSNNQMIGKGALAVGLVVTRHAKNLGLPLDPDALLTKGGGQVVGLGKSNVQSILSEYHIERVLAEEGGRTSRGSVGNMRKYVAFLNALPSQENIKGELDVIEKLWIDRIKAHFAEKPIILRFDLSKSLRVIIRELLAQAQKRQQESSGSMFVGTMLQHLVGAKLDLLLNTPVDHHGASVADEFSGRESDFLIEDVAIHITTAPSEALLQKCKRNIDAGLRPLIITTHNGVVVAEALSSQLGISDRLDIFEAEQFLAGNLYELGKFALAGRKATAVKLIERYNDIVSKCETDPGLLIEIAK